MSSSPTPFHSRPWGLMLLAVGLVAVNMRMTITGVGPLLEQIAADEGVAPAALGGLASVPLIAWGLVSPFTHSLSVRFGVERTITYSLIALGLGTIWRSLPGTSLNLWLGTALIGGALAIGNVLLPAVIRREFGARIPLVMGFYTALLGGFGAVSAGMVVPISQIPTSGGVLGWRIALVATGVCIPIALVAWVLIARGPLAPDPDQRDATPEAAAGAGRRIWRDPAAWSIALYMGCQSALFYMLSTWLAPIETSMGRDPIAAGLDVMTYQLFSIAGSLTLPLLYRGALRRGLAALLPLAIGAGFLGLVALPDARPLWLGLGGVASGLALSISLMFMATRAHTTQAASALSGMAQTVGYLLAASGPAAFGLLHGVSGAWLAPLLLVTAFAIAQLIFGVILGRGRFVFDAGSRPAS